LASVPVGMKIARSLPRMRAHCVSSSSTIPPSEYESGVIDFSSSRRGQQRCVLRRRQADTVAAQTHGAIRRCVAGTPIASACARRRRKGG
jgi:hypothetical protein